MHEESLFVAALDLPSAAARAAFLDRECGGDAGLRARVERLLAADQHSTGILDAGADTAGPAAHPLRHGPRLNPGWEFAGRFRLVRRLGAGGMGEVWEADQTAPVRRPVALKVIRPGLDAAALLARFDRERQALALMDHPHIARVFDAGVADGLPYLAMELVDGEAVTAFCDARQLPVRRRLELFVPVCRAVQHAHQKGVIHRDLKPSNILVAEGDGKPVPKVIDFGIAKAAGAKLSDETVRTGAGAILGTPEYMAPEQAAGDADIDTRADVYALGVLLYELLTGTTPHGRAGGGVLDLLRAIREIDPLPPSRRLRELRNAECGMRNQETRSSTPQSAIRNPHSQELDWVVMRCLEKDRARRYDTAAALARDVERFLADEVVEARPPSAGYKLRKFARRNRPQVVAAGLVLLALVGGVVGTTWGLVEARAGRDAANAARHDEAVQRERAEAERDAKEKERQRAAEEADIAKTVAAFVENDLLGQADIRNQSGGRPRDRNVTVRELLDRAAARIGNRFRDRERTEGSIRHTLGAAYRAIGEYEQAQKHLDRALELLSAKLGPDHPDTLAAANAVGELLSTRGRRDEAEAVLARTLAAYRRLGRGNDRAALGTALNLAEVYADRDRFDAAEALYVKTLDALREGYGEEDFITLKAMIDLARVYRRRGRPGKAAPLLARAAELAPTVLGPDHPGTIATLADAAAVHKTEGRLDDAERLFARVLGLCRAKHGPTHTDTLAAMLGLAQVYNARERFDRAEPLIREAIDGLTTRVGADDERTLVEVNSLAALHLRAGRPAEAEPLFRRAADGFRAKLGPDNRWTLTATLNRAVACRRAGRPDQAADLAEEVARGLERVRYEVERADEKMEDVIAILDEAGRLDAADGWRRKWVAVVKARAGAGAGSAEYADELAGLGASLSRRGKWAEAEPVLRECLAVREKLTPDDVRSADARSLLGGALLGLGKVAEAEPLLVAGYDGLKRRAADLPPQNRHVLPDAADRLVELYEKLGKLDETKKWRAERAKYPFVAPPPRPVLSARPG